MKSDYQHIIMYCGKTHSTHIVHLLSQLFPDIELSPLYENDDKQCISIPMYDGALLFTPDVYQDKPVKHVPVKKAVEKYYNPRYPSRRLVALRKSILAVGPPAFDLVGWLTAVHPDLAAFAGTLAEQGFVNMDLLQYLDLDACRELKIPLDLSMLLLLKIKEYAPAPVTLVPSAGGSY